MMIGKHLLSTVLILLMSVSICAAQSMEFDLSAGTTSVAGGVQFRKPLATGFMKIGLSGVCTDDDDMEYQWGNLSFVVGSDTLAPGLSVEVGLKGIFGSAEDNGYSGDVGAAAFTGRAGYIFPRRIMPVPLEVFGGVAYAPEPLSFMDTESYTEIFLGAGLRIIENASVVISLHSYEVEMEEGPGDWELDDEVIRAGVVLRF